MGPFEIATFPSGRFSIPNVTPGYEYVLYTKMQSLGGTGAVAARRISVGKSGTTFDAGTLSVEPAHTVSGRVKGLDHVPEGTRLMLDREGAWDALSVVLDPDGGFSFEGVPSEKVSLYLRVPGYRLASETPHLDAKGGGNGLALEVNGDTELEILMEPGARR